MSTTTAFHSKPPQTDEQGATGRRSPWVVAATRAMLNETQKSLWLLWGRRIVVLLEILSFIAFYPFLQFVIGNGTIQRALVLPTLLPFLAVPLLYLAILKLVSDLLEEVNSGTFEQMHLSPFSPAALLVGRLLAVFLEGALIAVVIGLGMSWLLGISIPLRPAGLLPAALTLHARRSGHAPGGAARAVAWISVGGWHTAAAPHPRSPASSPGLAGVPAQRSTGETAGDVAVRHIRSHLALAHTKPARNQRRISCREKDSYRRPHPRHCLQPVKRSEGYGPSPPLSATRFPRA